ncbi:MAG: hypothetical protein ACI4SM_06100 [Candidatus Gastranaerophilaceae bacterium]
MKQILVVCVFLLFVMPAYSADGVSLEKVEKQKVTLKEPVKKLKGSLLINDKQVIEELIELQKKKDMEDVETLWKGTVENNKVIEFALKKLATPESQRRIHSSLMSKTLSAIVSGASFLPSFAGADAYVQTSAFAAGRLAQNLINRKNVPKEVPLTDTELIELAGLVENLQDKIVDAYYNYKNSLLLLKDTRSRLLLYNKNYTQALDKGDILEITISSTMYDNMTLQEFQAEQAAKKYHLELQRLAGKKAVDKLNLYQFSVNSTLVNGGLK